MLSAENKFLFIYNIYFATPQVF